MRLPFMDKLPLNPNELIKHGAELDAERAKPVRIAILVEVDAPDELLKAVEERFVPRTAAVDISVDIAEERAIPIPSSTDAVVAILGSGGPAIVRAMTGPRGLSIPTVALHAGQIHMTAASIGQPLDDLLTDDDPVELVDEDLGEWLVGRLASKRLALAANFDFLRSVVANQHVKSTALQNALIGGITIIPGTDMPIMTANQAKMLLQIAAAYGMPLGAERIAELVAVVGGGFAFRAVARQVLDLVPGFGWLVKGGIGYTGTIAMGKAAIKYFEEGADLGDVSRRLAEAAKEFSESRRKQPAGTAAPETPAPYRLEPARVPDGES